MFGREFAFGGLGPYDDVDMQGSYELDVLGADAGPNRAYQDGWDGVHHIGKKWFRDDWDGVHH